MSEVRLLAEHRTEFGKGGARRTRRAGKIPAVIYGHGAEPKHISLPAREFTQAIRRGGANVLLTLEIDGKPELAIPKAMQRHAIKDVFEHVDLLSVRQGEKITVDVRLLIVGEVGRGGLLSQEHTTVSVEADATALPDSIEVDVEGAEVGTQITAGSLTLPAGTTLAGDPELVLLIVAEAPTSEQMEASGGDSSVEEVLADEAAAAAATPAV